jgi:hypothetical protein
MSKGSRPRPFSVDQTTFANNYDAVFGKNKDKHIDNAILSVYNDERLVSKFDKQSLKCWCYNCSTPEHRMSHMILCPTCGNKRCPRATDHTLTCTDSNESGQPGSRY